MSSPSRQQLMHEKAFNLARRYTAVNENDLMQENYYEDSEKKPTYDLMYCRELATHLSHMRNLPIQCQKYGDIKADLRRRETDNSHGTSILG